MNDTASTETQPTSPIEYLQHFGRDRIDDGLIPLLYLSVYINNTKLDLDPYSRDRVKLHNGSQRITNLIQNILNAKEEDKFQVTYSDLVADPEKYGLRSYDVSSIETAEARLTAQESMLESKYGVLRVDKWRESLSRKLSTGSKPRTILQIDLANLKSFNQENPVFGDIALETIAKNLKAFLQKQGVDESELNFLIGRKGDEFYVDLGAIQPSEDLAKQFNDFLNTDPNCQRSITYNGKTRAINSYWRLAEVDLENFDQQMFNLETSIEEAKIHSMSNFAKEITASNPESTARKTIELVIAYLASKRFDQHIIKALLELDAKGFVRFTGDNFTQAELDVYINQLMDGSASDERIKELDEIINNTTTISSLKPEDRVIKLPQLSPKAS